MRISSSISINRLDRAVLALGAGVLVAIAGAGPAAADTRGTSDSTGTDATTSSERGASRSHRRGNPGTPPNIRANDRSPAARIDSPVPRPARSLPSTEPADIPARASTFPEPFDVPAPVITPAVTPSSPSAAVVAQVVPPPAAAVSLTAPSLPVVQSSTVTPTRLSAGPARVAAPARAIDVLLGALPGPGPSQPADSPVNWTVLAAARREIGAPRSASITAVSASTGQPVLPSATVSAAAATANQSPVIVGVKLSTPNTSTGAVTGIVTATDPNADRMTYRATTSTKGRVTITRAGVFTYTPTTTARHAAAKLGAPVSSRADTVTVTVTDANGATASRTVTVPILSRNTAPVPRLSVGTPNSITGVVTGSVRATDADGDTRTYAGNTTTTKGSVTVDKATGAFTYTPTPSARHKASAAGVATADKTDSFTLTVTDGYGGTVAVPVTVQISPKNTSPVASAVIGKPDPISGVARGKVTASDADSDPVTYTATKPANGTVTLGANGDFTYTPTATARRSARTATAVMTDPFTVTVIDGHNGSATVNVIATIAPSNAAPKPGTPTVNVNLSTGVVTGTVNATDPDNDTLAYAAVNTTTAKGTVAVANNGAFTYTPTATARKNAASPVATSADKTDTFTVSVTDKYGSATAIAVNVPVTPAVDPVVPGTGHMAVGMNLESVVDWSPAWTFTDAFKASRPWISHSFNPQTWSTTWDPAQAPTLDLDGNGNVRSLKTWTANGVQMEQHAGTLMFDGLDGDYAAGTYHAQWDGTGVVTFGNDAVVTSSGTTPEGRNFAELQVTPTNSGIYMAIEETDPTDPVRDFNVWMPDYNGRSFVGQRWQPGATFSPFHPLFLSRLDSFDTLRFMGMQETNSSDIVTWEQRRDAHDIRQGSGAEGTPSEPIANGMSLEYMVELANELDADPWFNMPYQADDTFVRNFATYVSRHLEPGRKVYVEWANEVWNFGYGFEASQWVADKATAAGLDPDYGQWIVAGQEAKRDYAIWSEVFAKQSALQLVRVAPGWAAVDWVTNQIAENMGGQFDVIAIAPYITPTDAQRASYDASTSVDQVIADTRTNMTTSVQWVADHERLAQAWSAKLGRPIQLVAYEGGPHLDGRGAAYQNAFYAATNDSRMGAIYRDYLKRLDSAGMDLFMDFQFTGQAGAAPWGDFAKLHRMDEPLATAYRYNAVVSAADGTLWTVL